MGKLRNELMLHVGGSFIEHACYHQLTEDEVNATLEDLLISHLKSTGKLKSYFKESKKQKKKEKKPKDKKILQFPEVWND